MAPLVQVVVPFGSDCEWRQRNHARILRWIAEHHPDWTVVAGESDRDPFSPAQARNNGAGKGQWDVVVFWDADTIAHPDAVREAVRRAAAAPVMFLAGDSHIYTDELSANRFHATGLMFPRPRGDETKRFDHQGIYRRPCSGILAVGRPLWEATGGYVDCLGGEDSHEDLVFFQQCQIFGKGVRWCAGIQLHLWHPPADRAKGRNHKLWRDLANMKDEPERARKYLAQKFGHHAPIPS